MVVDDNRMRDELGYEEVFSLEDGVRRAFAWTRENPPPKFNRRMLDYALEDAALEAYQEATRS